MRVKERNALICEKDGIVSLNALGGRGASSVELLASYLKFRYENYDGEISINSNSYQNFVYKRATTPRSKFVKNFLGFVKENFIQDNKNYIDCYTFHLERMTTVEEISTAVNLVNKTHPIYDIIENINGIEKFPCGNIMEYCTDEEFNAVVGSIDFEFTTLRNVLYLTDFIYLDRKDATRLGEDYHIGLLTDDSGKKTYRVMKGKDVYADYTFDELSSVYNCSDFKED